MRSFSALDSDDEDGGGASERRGAAAAAAAAAGRKGGAKGGAEPLPASRECYVCYKPLSTSLAPAKCSGCQCLFHADCITKWAQSSFSNTNSDFVSCPM